MGYTHYYRGWVTLNADFLEEVQQIIDNSDADIRDWNGFGLPKLTKDEIRLNGTDEDDNSHETFVLVNGVNHSTSFCKTNLKPYDEVVGAILLRASYHNKAFKIKNDGDWVKDWQLARALYFETFGVEAERPSEIVLSYSDLRKAAASIAS